MCMKSILKELIQIKYAIGYDGEPIEVGGIYYSVGNSHFRFEIINIIDKYNIEYVIDSAHVKGEWTPYDKKLKDIKKSRSCYLISHNIYGNHYGEFF